MRLTGRRIPWSISTKLPLGIGALLLAVTGGLTAAAFQEVRRSQIEAASDRLGELCWQFADFFGATTAQRCAALQRLASDARVSAMLSNPSSAENAAAASESLERFLEVNEPTAAIELWNAGGERVFQHGRVFPALPPRAALELVSAVDTFRTAAVSALSRLDGGLYFRVVTSFEAPDGSAGFVCEVRRVTNSSRSAAALASLLGSQARLLVGSQNGVWHEFSRDVAAPPS